MKENEEFHDKMRELNKELEQFKQMVMKQQVEMNEMKEMRGMTLSFFRYIEFS